MKKKFLSFIKKYWLACWLILSFVSFTTIGIVYASYTKTSSAKLVIARVGNSGKLFSSNYLQKGTMANAVLYIDADDNELVDFVRISNFAQGNPGKPYARAINYNLSIKLVYQSNGEYVSFSDTAKIGQRYIKVSLNGGEDVIFGYDADTNTYKNYTIAYTTGSSLAGASPNTDTLRIEYSENQKVLLSTPDPDLPKMYLEITATPTPTDNYLDIDPLVGRLDLQLTGQVQSVVWNGYINEDGARDETGTAVPAATLDDYNYVIEGTGEGTITLRWDSTYLELNKDFIAQLTAITGNSATADSVTFSVNSNTTSRYDTQFYRTGQALTNYDTWDEVNGYITCTFTPATAGTP